MCTKSILPSGENLYESWESIRAGLDHVTDLPADRVDITAYYNPDKTMKDHVYCKRGGFIPDFDYDPRDYGLNMLQMEDSDANQTLTLLKVKECLLDASISPSSKERKNIGVVLGIGGGQKASHEFYSRLNYVVMEKVLRKMGMPDEDVKVAVEKYKGNFPEWRLDTFPGFLGNVTAGRCCNVFNLDGMNCVVDAACASSLIALKVGIDELLHGDCKTMIVGATCTDNSLGMYMAFSKTPVFSTDQKVKAYDQSTKGMLIGEGSVMMVIKRLADAEMDGDSIYAVIRGVASSSDGKAPGIYVPTISGQETCVQRAWAKTGLDPTTCTLVEGHGTGTPVGDKIELTGLRNVFQAAGCTNEQIATGSIKSQIGHLKAVAGMAGLVKVVLALKHKILPGSINVETPPDLTDHTKLPDTCLYINTKNRPWFVDPRIGVRRAGISSFGFGGANYHCIVDEYESEHTKPYRMHEMPLPCVLAAPSPRQLAADARAVAQQIAALSPKSDDAYDVFAAFRAKHHVGAAGSLPPINQPRIGLLAKDAATLAADLAQVADAIDRDANAGEIKLRGDLIYRSRALDVKGKVAALFAGQGSQYVNMYEETAMNWPEFRQAVVDMDRASSQVCGVRASSVMYPRNPHADEPDLAKTQEAKISTVQNAQLSIVAVSVGGYAVFERAGFKPDFVAGHSLGEYPALYAAGALSRDELCELVCARAHAMQTAPQMDAEPGRMVAVVGDKAESIRPEAEGVWLANCNSPSQIVLTGTERGIAEDSKRLSAAGFRVVPLNTGGAFHSPRMAPAERVFNQRLAAAKVSPLAFDAPRAYANVSGDVLPQGDAEATRRSLAKQMTSSVQFTAQVRAMYRDGARVFVEFGPKNTLTKLVQQILDGAPDVVCIALNPSPNKPSDVQLREAAMQAAVAGVPFTKPFDPWSVRNPFKGHGGYSGDVEADKKARASKTRMRLSASTYVSKKTLTERERLMNDGCMLSCYSKSPRAELGGNSAEEVARLRSQLDELKSSLAAAKREAAQAKETLDKRASGEAALAPAQRLAVEQLFKSYEAQLKNVLAGAAPMPPSSFAPVAAPPPVVAAPALQRKPEAPRAAVAATASLSKEQVVRIMTKLLAGTTGFTEDMITDELDLEDDLGVDSIKRVELTSSASAELKVTVSDEAMTALSRARTVGEVVKVFVQQVASGAPVPSPSPSPSSQGGGVSVDAVVRTMRTLLAATTGFSEDMITDDLSLEDDLGVDSIKRVELTSSASAALKVTVNDEAMTALSRARTVGEVVKVFCEQVGSSGAAPAAAKPAASMIATPAPRTPAPTASSSSSNGVSTEQVVKVMLQLLSATTGFSEDMITNDLSLEDDLGVDSIKRVELTSSASAALKVTVNDEAMTALSRARTVGEVVKVFCQQVGSSGAAPSTPAETFHTPLSSPAPVAATPVKQSGSNGVSTEQVVKVMLQLLSATTGFSEDMITNDLSLEDDLGVDSIKRVELTSSASAALKVTVNDEAMTALSRARTVGEVVQVFCEQVSGGNGHAAAAPTPTPAKPAVAITAAPKTPATTNGSSNGAGVSTEQVVKVMLQLLSATTGFSEDMITNDLSLEDDLGVDSIKRVELTSSASAALKVTVNDEAMTALSRARTVGEVVQVFCEQVSGGNGHAATALPTPPPSAVARPAATPVAAAAPTPAKQPSNGTAASVSTEQVVKIMLQLLSATTGFSEDMITDDLSLEDDLGVDSIKRVELTSSASAALKVTVNDEAMTALSRARTVGEVVQVFCEQVGGGNGHTAAAAAKPAPAAAPAAKATAIPATPSASGNVVAVMNKLLSATTGFDVDMITPELSLEDDLGVDSIKRVELTSSASAALGVTVSDEAMTALSRARTVGEVVDVFEKFVGRGAAPANVR